MIDLMPELSARLRRLRRLPRPQRVAALRSVLVWATGDELEAFAAEAIELANRSKHKWGLLTEVLRAWPRLSFEARAAAIVVAGDRLNAFVVALEGSDDRSDRRAASEIASACLAGEPPAPEGSEASLALVLHRLSADQGAIAHAALTGLATAVRAVEPADVLGALLDAAVADAAERYHEHRHDALMRAIADRAHKCGPRLTAWLNQRDDVGHMAMRSAARKRGAGEAIATAVTNLGVPSLAPAAVSALEKIKAPEERAIPLAQGHLLVSRSRGSKLGRLRTPDALLGEAWDASLPLDARLGAIEWIGRVPMKPTERVRRLSETLGDPDVGVRLRACLALRDCPASAPTDRALRDFAFDPDPRVAHAALSALVTATTQRRREAHRDLFEQLERSPHEHVRVLATKSIGALRSQESSDEGLREALQSDDRARVLDALGGVIRRDRCEAFLDELLVLATATDPFVSAKAVRGLTHTPGDDARGALLEALGHSDGRVVADAVEALGFRDGGAISLKAFTTSAVARVRANAVRHALRTDPGGHPARDTLAEMLTDPRASHRLSALWVTERTAQTALSERIAEMINSDDEREVRVRAERTAHRLLAQMRDGWSRSASSNMAAG